MITAIIDAEQEYLGCRYGHIKEEFKGKKFLKRKVFAQATREQPIDPATRRELALACITDGAAAIPRQITALAQAKLAFIHEVFSIAERFHCKTLACIVKRGAPKPANDALRKDYAYLFERFFYFCEDAGPTTQGAIVFDELDKTQSKILLGQMEEYFTKYGRGKFRSTQIIPQPFFVHSDLTTLIQVADVIAYILSWGYEINRSFVQVTREELRPYGTRVEALRYDARRRIGNKPSFHIWGICPLDDLRGAEEKAT